MLLLLLKMFAAEHVKVKNPSDIAFIGATSRGALNTFIVAAGLAV